MPEPGAFASDRGSRLTGQRSAVTGGPRTTGTHSAMTNRARKGSGRVMLAVIIVLMIGLAGVWSFVAQRQLSASIARENAEHLEHARTTFHSIRARTLDNLRAHCRVMVEDPRLKSTLATEGVDEATVADILGDLVKLRRTGFLMVLSLDGKVFAEAGADELRGLDLSSSSPVKKVASSAEAVVGSWVIGGKIMDLSIMGVLFGTSPVAYLVVGQAVDQDMLKAVTYQTGVAVATATGQSVTLSSSPDDSLKPVFAAVAGQAGSFLGRGLEVGGQRYVTAISELEDISQSRPRLILVQSLAQASSSFETMWWLIYVPPVLVLVAILLAMTANRRAVIVRHP